MLRLWIPRVWVVVSGNRTAEARRALVAAFPSPQACHMAGFPRSCVVEVPTDADYRLSIAALEEAVAAERVSGPGVVPLMVVATAGTTNTSAVDDLAAVADLCLREGMWFHVDAAYGGFFNLTDRGRARLEGLSLVCVFFFWGGGGLDRFEDMASTVLLLAPYQAAACHQSRPPIFYTRRS